MKARQGKVESPYIQQTIAELEVEEMNAYIVESNKKIEPFGDHPRDCLIGNRKLGDIQKEVLQSLTLTLKATSDPKQIEDPNEHIVFVDSLLFSKEMLQEFIKQSRKLKRPTICAVKPPDLTGVFDRVLATQEVQIYPDRIEYALHYVPPLTSRGEPVPVLINVEQHCGKAPCPEHFSGCREFRVLMSDRVLVQIDHWGNIHDANMAMVQAVPARRLLNSKAKMLGAVLRARSLNQWKLLHQINKIGKNCNIHPTAWIECSTLGDNVQVGAGSVITGSLVGDNNFISNSVTMFFSTTGDRCYIGGGATLQFALLYPGVNSMARLINYAVCGRDAFLGDGVTLSDYRIDERNITVMKNGMPVDTGSRVSGVCLGHGVYLAAGCVVGPGRAIPNGMRIAPEGSRYIGSWDAEGNIPGHQRVSVHASPPPLPQKTEQGTRGSLLRRILRLPSIK